MYNVEKREIVMSKRIELLVVEDDENICLEYAELSKQFDDIFLIGTSAYSTEALKITDEFHPNAVVLDLELQKGGGSGIDYLVGLEKLNLKTKPFVLVVTNNVSPVTQAVVRNFGADYIIVKSQSDYSVSMVVNMLRNVISQIPDMNAKTQTCSPSIKKRIEDDYNQRLVKSITRELDIIGISPRFKGRNYLRDAIELICHKEQTYICNEVAKKYGKTSASVERAMQNAIDHAWKTTDTETLEEHYMAYINPRKGVPTLTEFIYYYADKVKKNME